MMFLRTLLGTMAVTMTQASLGSGVANIIFGDCQNEGRIAELLDVQPRRIKLGGETELAFHMSFLDDFEGGTFESVISIGDIPLTTKSGDACSSGEAELPQLGKVSWEGETCPVKKAENHIMSMNVTLVEMNTSKIESLKIKWTLKDKTGTEKACAHAVATTNDCHSFFGEVGGLVTITNPDLGLTKATEKYCDLYNQRSPCVFVNFGGERSDCVVPSPPKGAGCLRYVKATYSDNCTALAKFPPPTGMDRGFYFGHDGVYRACEDSVVSTEVHCFQQDDGFDTPQLCHCPTPPLSNLVV